MMEIKIYDKVRTEELNAFRTFLETILEELGFKTLRNEMRIGKRVTVLRYTFRLNTDKWGHNVSNYTYRRVNYLNYQQYAILNYLINAIIDWSNLQKVKAYSLKGKFVIRDFNGAKYLEDWQQMEYVNVGSELQSVYLIEKFPPDDYSKYEEMVQRCVDTLYNLVRSGKCQYTENDIRELVTYVLC